MHSHLITPPPPPPPPIRWDHRKDPPARPVRVIAGVAVVIAALAALVWGGASAGEASLRHQLTDRDLSTIEIRADYVWCLKGEFGWAWSGTRDGQPVTGHACTGGLRGVWIREATRHD